MDNNEFEIEAPVLTLTLEDDTEMECAVLSVFPVEGYDGDYAALISMDDLNNEDEDGEIFLYRYKELDGDDVDLKNIESDEEFEAVSEAFDAILDEQEFNNLD